MPIEIERKFHMTDGQLAEVQRKGELVSQSSFTDIYYDDWQYSLTSQSRWLRSRDGQFELKVRKSVGVNDIYEEITGNAIADYLFNGAELGEALDEQGIAPFAQFATTRSTYRFGGARIDLDIADFGYRIAEIEVLAASDEEVEAAEATVMEVANQLSLSPIAHAEGKLMVYLRERCPDHYAHLVESGAIRSSS